MSSLSLLRRMMPCDTLVLARAPTQVHRVRSAQVGGSLPHLQAQPFGDSQHDGRLPRAGHLHGRRQPSRLHGAPNEAVHPVVDLTRLGRARAGGRGSAICGAPFFNTAGSHTCLCGGFSRASKVHFFASVAGRLRARCYMLRDR